MWFSASVFYFIINTSHLHKCQFQRDCRYRCEKPSMANKKIENIFMTLREQGFLSRTQKTLTLNENTDKNA